MPSWDAGSIEARLLLDRSDFTRGLDQSKTDADKFSGKDYTAKLKADNSAANKALTDTQGRADKLAKTAPGIKITASNDSANRQIDDTQAKADKLGRTSASVNVKAGGTQEAGSLLTSLIASATAVAPAFVVAGIGIASFAALAAPSIEKVVKAQSDMASGAAGASAEHKALTASQKDALSGVTQLEGSYKRLSVAVQPQVMQIFNEALSTADAILPHLVPLAKEGGDALASLVRTLGGVATDSGAHQFAQFLGREIPQDMKAIGQLLPPIVHLFEGLVEDLNPLAVTALHLAGDITSLAAGFTHLSPLLTEVAVGGLALYKPFVLAANSAENLRLLRQGRGWSQQDVAEKMRAYGTSGARRPSLAWSPPRVRSGSNELTDLALLYGVSLAQFLDSRVPDFAWDDLDALEQEIAGLMRERAGTQEALQAEQMLMDSAAQAHAIYRAELARIEGRLAVLRRWHPRFDEIAHGPRDGIKKADGRE